MCWVLEQGARVLLIRNLEFAGTVRTRYSDLAHALRGLGEFMRESLVQYMHCSIHVEGSGEVAAASIGPLEDDVVNSLNGTVASS